MENFFFCVVRNPLCTSPFCTQRALYHKLSSVPLYLTFLNLLRVLQSYPPLFISVLVSDVLTLPFSDIFSRGRIFFSVFFVLYCWRYINLIFPKSVVVIGHFYFYHYWYYYCYYYYYYCYYYYYYCLRILLVANCCMT